MYVYIYNMYNKYVYIYIYVVNVFCSLFCGCFLVFCGLFQLRPGRKKHPSLILWLLWQDGLVFLWSPI